MKSQNLITDLLRGDTVYLKDMEDKDNDSFEVDDVTDEEGDEDTVGRVGLFLLTRGTASTRRCCAVQRSVVLVVTL